MPVTGRLAGGRLYLVLAGAALAIAALSLLIPSTPSYDPWAWLVWGKEIAHLDLVTTGGPTWKPLPVIFTTVFSVFGNASPDLWLVVARAGALMAVAMTFKVAWRIARDIVSVPADAVGWARRMGVLPVLVAATIPAAGDVPDQVRGAVGDGGGRVRSLAHAGDVVAARPAAQRDPRQAAAAPRRCGRVAVVDRDRGADAGRVQRERSLPGARLGVDLDRGRCRLGVGRDDRRKPGGPILRRDAPPLGLGHRGGSSDRAGDPDRRAAVDRAQHHRRARDAPGARLPGAPAHRHDPRSPGRGRALADPGLRHGHDRGLPGADAGLEPRRAHDADRG